jgi:hypothetical protein
MRASSALSHWRVVINPVRLLHCTLRRGLSDFTLITLVAFGPVIVTLYRKLRPIYGDWYCTARLCEETAKEQVGQNGNLQLPGGPIL